MEQIITSVPMVSVQSNIHAECPVTGEIITTHRKRAEIMAKYDLVDAGDFPPDKVIAKRKVRQAKVDALDAEYRKNTEHLRLKR